METTPIKLNITRIEAIKGSFEGHEYYQLRAQTEEGFVLKTKLTAFEYNVVKDNYNA